MHLSTVTNRSDNTIMGTTNRLGQRRRGFSAGFLVAGLAVAATAGVMNTANGLGETETKLSSAKAPEEKRPDLTPNVKHEKNREAAQQHTRFKIKEAKFLPTGWNKLSSSVTAYDLDEEGTVDLHMFTEVFAPKGTAEGDELGLQISQADETGRPEDITSRPTVVLDDGTIAYLAPAVTGVGGAVTWWANGVYYNVSAAGLAQHELIRIANSLNAK